MEKTQKEYYLNEQMKAIQKELDEESGNEIEDLAKKIEKTKLTKEIKTRLYKQKAQANESDVG